MANIGECTSSFLIFMPHIFFAYLIPLATTFSTILISSSGRQASSFVPDWCVIAPSDIMRALRRMCASNAGVFF